MNALGLEEVVQFHFKSTVSTSSIVQTWSLSPDSIVGVTQSVLLTRQKS
jgi:hypothetical protein